MEGCATGLADAAARYAADKVGVGNSNVHSGVKLDLEVLQDVIKSSSLFLRAWESIQDESFDTVRLAQAFPYDSNGDFVGHQSAGVHIFLGFLAQFRSIFHSRTEHISRGNMGNWEVGN